ncbi:hypothetical protein [Peribacillus acanthi]|uniref:hypothetical protein n=1 Tax=Peribacillus acanthi TaxID=2171554 RepID=UPI0013003CDF|nr:hypothetical protein [Peribacillus acanthi]
MFTKMRMLLLVSVFCVLLHINGFEANAADPIGTFQPVKGLVHNQDAIYITDAIVTKGDKVVVLAESRPFMYDALKNSWEYLKGGHIYQPRSLAALQNGNVLFIAGKKKGEENFNQNQIFDVKKKTFKMVSPLPGYYEYITNIQSTTLKNNHVLVMGSYQLYKQEYEFVFEYDPTKDVWMEREKLSYQADKLVMNNNGDALLYGGKPGESISHAQFYDTKLDKIVPASRLLKHIVLSAHAPLLDGKFLLAGGSWPGGIQPTNVASIFDPVTNHWKNISPMKTSRAMATAALLPDGRVIVVGGMDAIHYQYLQTTEIYDPRTNTWTNGPTMKTKHEKPVLVPLSNNDLLVFGSSGGKTMPVEKLKISTNLRSKSKATYQYKESASVLKLNNPMVNTKAESRNLGYSPVMINKQVYIPTTALSLFQVEKSPSVKKINGKSYFLLNDFAKATNQQVARTGDLILLSSKPIYFDKHDYDRWLTWYDPNHRLGIAYEGSIVKKSKLFEEAGWTYTKYYVRDKYPSHLFNSEGTEYTYDYILREKRGAVEFVNGGSSEFLKEEDGTLYFVQNRYLLKKSLGEVYGTPLIKPYPKLAHNRLKPLLNGWDYLHEGEPLEISLEHFDGNYIYTWWAEAHDHPYPGIPVKVKFDGSELHLLSSVPSRHYNDDIKVYGDYLYYFTNPLDIEEHRAGQKYKLHMVKKDGSVEKDIAYVKGYQIYQNKIYYKNADDLVPGTFEMVGRFYSMNLDGSGKKLLTKDAVAPYYFLKNKIIYSTFESDLIVQMNMDGSARKVLAKGTKNILLEILTVTESYITYKKTNTTNEKIIGKYKMDLKTFKEIKI